MSEKTETDDDERSWITTGELPKDQMLHYQWRWELYKKNPTEENPDMIIRIGISPWYKVESVYNVEFASRAKSVARRRDAELYIFKEKMQLVSDIKDL